MIRVILTGGTIASVKSTMGFAPAPGVNFETLIAACARRLGVEVATHNWFDRQGNELPPIDSCVMTPAHWLDLHHTIITLSRSDCEAIVVLHGTDTMAYTASALALLGSATEVPVVLTGAQVPFLEPNSDAEANINFALRCALGCAQRTAKDVWLAFAHKLMRGIRASKVNADDYHAFDSVDGGIALDALRPRSTTFGAFHDPELGFVGSVLSLNVNPSGAILPLLDTIAHQPPGGLLLNLYGAGSGPDLSAIAGKIAALSNVGWLCVGRSICLRGTTDWSRYAATHCLVDTPLISASDMTLEAATVKLMAALARPIGQGEWFRKNVAGESSG